MAKTKARKPRERKAKQGHLPGLEPVEIKEVSSAAETYYETMLERCALSKDEDEAKDALIDAMNKHNLTRYQYEDKIVTIVPKLGVKVKKAKEESVQDSLAAAGE